MGKKFMGLGGTDHFWDRAKAWILNQITSAVAAKIAEVVANAPEDLDTLKEIADWISAHADDAAAMNTQITENKNNIATNTSDISALKTSVAGKADKVHTHTKSEITDFPASLKNPNALTVNGKTYDGSEAVDAGVQTVANGGTGATTEKAAFMNLANGLQEGSGPLDTEYMIYKNTGGTNWGLYTLSTFWEYIKGKISSVLGLTKDNYGGKAASAGSAGTADSLFYRHGNEINFKGGAQGQCWFNYRNADTGGPSPVDTMEYRFCNYSGDTSKSVLIAGTAKTSSKMVIPIGAPSSLEDGCIWIER